MTRLHFFLIVVFLILSDLGMAQKIMTLDFKTKKATGIPTSIGEGDYYQLKIENINLNLYKVFVNHNDTTISQPIEVPTFTSLPIDGLSELVQKLGGLSVSEIPELENVPLETFDMVKSINTKSMPKKVANETEEVKKQINTFLEATSGLINNGKSVSDSLNNFKLDIYIARLHYLGAEVKNPITDFRTVLSDLQKVRKQLVDTRGNLVKLGKEISTFVNIKKPIIEANSDLKEVRDQLLKTNSSAVTDLNKIIDAVNAEKINELLASIAFLQGNKKEYLSLPFQLNGERAILNYTIAPRDDKYKLQKYSSKIVFPNRKRTKVTVGMSFYGATLHDQAFSARGIQETDTTSVFQVVEEDVTELEIGIAALVRFNPGFDKLNRLHFSVGPGMTITNTVRPRLLLGVGSSWGDKHNFAIDVGLIMGSVEKRSKVVDLTATYQEAPADVTTNDLEFGAYLSLGYFFRL